MKPLVYLFAAFTLAAGCAEDTLLKKEGGVLKDEPVTSQSDLKLLGAHSAALSVAYREAAREAQRHQDMAAVVTFLSAASFVSGAAGTASNAALADKALVGIGSTTLSARITSREVIEGIYSSAKRMNCVATTSRMGVVLLKETPEEIEDIAGAATFGAIEEIKIIVREALVRDVADFKQIRDDLINGALLTAKQMEVFNEKKNGRNLRKEDIVVLNQYLKLLGNCLGAEASLTAIKPIDQSTSQ